MNAGTQHDNPHDAVNIDNDVRDASLDIQQHVVAQHTAYMLQCMQFNQTDPTCSLGNMLLQGISDLDSSTYCITYCITADQT